MSTLLNGIYQNAVFSESQINVGDNLNRELVIVSDFQNNGVLGTDANKWNYLIGYDIQTGTSAGCVRRNLATLEGLSSTAAWPLSGSSKVFIDKNVNYNWITGTVDWSMQKALEELDSRVSLLTAITSNDITNLGMKHLKDGTMNGSVVSANLGHTAIANGLASISIGDISNRILNGHFSNISGGIGNKIDSSESSVISGGQKNTIDSMGSNQVIGGGEGNIVKSPDAAVLSGVYNTITSSLIYKSPTAVIAGGLLNSISGSSNAVIGGGYSNIIVDGHGGGGDSSSASIIVGGSLNAIDMGHSFIGSGEGNNIGIELLVDGATVNVTTNTISGPTNLANDQAIRIGNNVQRNYLIDSIDVYAYADGVAITPGMVFYVRDYAPGTLRLSKTIGGLPVVLTTPNLLDNSASVALAIYSVATYPNSYNGIIGGRYNRIRDKYLYGSYGPASHNIIGTGDMNEIRSSYSVILNGMNNIVKGSIGNIIGSGYWNRIDAHGFNVILTGEQNAITNNGNSNASNSIILAGVYNEINASAYNMVLNGERNSIKNISVNGYSNSYNTIINGRFNKLEGVNNTIINGDHAEILRTYRTFNNESGNYGNTIIGGLSDWDGSRIYASVASINSAAGSVIYNSHAAGIFTGFRNSLESSAAATIIGGHGNRLGGYIYLEAPNFTVNTTNNTINIAINYMRDKRVNLFDVVMFTGGVSPSNLVDGKKYFIFKVDYFGEGSFQICEINQNAKKLDEYSLIAVDLVASDATTMTMTIGRGSDAGLLGGIDNILSAPRAVLLGGGKHNLGSSSYCASIIGGDSHTMEYKSALSFIAGGELNLLEGGVSTMITTSKSSIIDTTYGLIFTYDEFGVPVGLNEFNVMMGTNNSVILDSNKSIIIGGLNNQIKYEHTSMILSSSNCVISELSTNGKQSNNIIGSFDSRIESNNNSFILNGRNSIILDDGINSFGMGMGNMLIGAPNSTMSRSMFCSMINTMGCVIHGSVGNSHIMGAAGAKIEVGAGCHIYGGGTSIISGIASNGAFFSTATNTILNGGNTLIHASNKSTIVNGENIRIFGKSNNSTILNGSSMSINYANYSSINNGQSNAISGYGYTAYIDPVDAGHSAANCNNATIINGNNNHIFNGSSYSTIITGYTNLITNAPGDTSEGCVIVNGNSNTLSGGNNITIIGSNSCTAPFTGKHAVTLIGIDSFTGPVVDNTTYMKNISVGGVFYDVNGSTGSAGMSLKWSAAGPVWSL